MTLFHEGDNAGPVMVLLSGRVKAVAVDAGGHEAIVALRGPGDLLGELSAIDGAPRSVTVTTLEPVEALVLAGSVFAAFLERRPRVALVILRMVAGRLRYADTRHADLASHDVVGRVASRLVELSERYGVEAGGRIEVELPLSQEEIASWVGASREAVSKALQRAAVAGDRRDRGAGGSRCSTWRPCAGTRGRSRLVWRIAQSGASKSVERGGRRA